LQRWSRRRRGWSASADHDRGRAGAASRDCQDDRHIGETPLADEIISCIERQQAETRKFSNESIKLAAEAGKLIAEFRALMCLARHG